MATDSFLSQLFGALLSEYRLNLCVRNILCICNCMFLSLSVCVCFNFKFNYKLTFERKQLYPFSVTITYRTHKNTHTRTHSHTLLGTKKEYTREYHWKQTLEKQLRRIFSVFRFNFTHLIFLCCRRCRRRHNHCYCSNWFEIFN